MTLIVSFSLVIFSHAQDSTALKIHNAENYPRWLMKDSSITSQTSGMTFLREIDNCTLEFLLADDIGKLHRLFIREDTLFSFSEIKFSNEVIEYLSDFPKHDFEEICYDNYTGDVYLTIEGNDDNHLLYHGIYKLKFFDNNIFQDSVIKLEKLEFTPQEAFYNNLSPNVGYEGFAADENYFYLGLESIMTPDNDFSGHTIIKVADKKSLTIVKEISTENIDISTVCGLYSEENFSLWGIDRNHRKVFKLKFDEYFNITDLTFFGIKTLVPKYNHFEYVGSLESITIVSGKFLFLVDDPWHKFFIPPDEILEQLDESAINNFNNFIPVIHKFVIE